MKSFTILYTFFYPSRKMNNAVVFCSFFLATSVRACFLYDYWFSDSSTSRSSSYKEIRSFSSSSASEINMEISSLSHTAKPYTAKAPDQRNLEFAESQQFLPNYEPQQAILQTYSIEEEDTSTNVDDSIYDRSTSATNLLKIPSPYQQRDSPKPDLNCIIFNDSVCSITCNQVCLLYNFESTGICTDQKTCYCTIVGMKLPAMSLTQFENQSLDELWYYKFIKSSVSADILNKIKKYPTMSSKVLNMLRKPLRTGDDVKNRLSTAYPKWTALHDLKSRRIAPINRFIDNKYTLDEFGLENRIKRAAKKYRKEIVKQFSTIDYLDTLTQYLDTIDDEILLKHIFKQIHDTKIESLINHVKDYLQQRDLDFSIEDLGSTECDCVDVDYIDNIVAGALIHQFLDMISAATKSSNSAADNTGKSSKTDAIQSSTISHDSLHSTDNTYTNSNQCSCSTNLGTQDLDDDSRWELPGFDQIMLRDYRGSVEEVWDTGNYYVSYKRWSSGSIDLEWKKGKDKVKINVYSGGSIDQEWIFDNASISLSYYSGGSIDESWQLGEVSYTFKRYSSGSTERKWKNNNSNQNILAKYQGYILAWCAKNYFLIETRHCVIY